MPKPIIRLWGDESNIGLIILRETGVLISNQTGGYTCNQPEAEGVYLPIGPLEDKYLWHLQHLFGDGWFGGMDDAIADKLDDFLLMAQFGSYSFMKVDRSRMSESEEAWMFVDVFEPEIIIGTNISIMIGFGQTKGVLTWANSD